MTKSKTAQRKVKKPRSRAYPAIALGRAIELVKKLFDGYGVGPHSRDNIAKGFGYASFSGAASAKIGSLVHFGLLSRANGRYSVTFLAREAFSYPAEESGPAIVSAALEPALYRQLAARFSGGSLPKSLDGILVADYGITPKVASTAAENFVRTMEFAGLIKDGRLVVSEAENRSLPPEPDKNQLFKNRSASGLGEAIKIKLASGIEILFPETMAYRVSMGEFGQEIKNLDEKAAGASDFGSGAVE